MEELEQPRMMLLDEAMDEVIRAHCDGAPYVAELYQALRAGRRGQVRRRRRTLLRIGEAAFRRWVGCCGELEEHELRPCRRCLADAAVVEAVQALRLDEPGTVEEAARRAHSAWVLHLAALGRVRGTPASEHAPTTGDPVRAGPPPRILDPVDAAAPETGQRTCKGAPPAG